MTAPPLSLRAYARRRGVSPEAVSKAVTTGRLKDSVVDGKIADPDLADREWDANTQRRPSAIEHNVEQAGVAQAPGETDDELKESARRSLDTPPARPRPADLPPGVADLNTSRAVRAHALARRDTAHADLAELELAQKRGRLVDAEGARADVEQAYSLVKTRLLGVPTQLAQRLPHFAAEVVPVIDALLREALEELAR